MNQAIWWILPGVCALIGALLTLSGIGKLIGLRLATGGARLLLGAGTLGIAGVLAFAGLNLQTYKRLTYERTIATVTFRALPEPGQFQADVVFEGGEKAQYNLRGDEFTLRAQVIKFTPMANLMGYDSVYRFDRLESGFRADTGDDVSRVVHAMTPDPGLKVFEEIRKRDKDLSWVDTAYGSAVYNPMADGFEYVIRMNQSGLEAEPGNADTRKAVLPGQAG
jgi:hypothetical protein